MANQLTYYVRRRLVFQPGEVIVMKGFFNISFLITFSFLFAGDSLAGKPEVLDVKVNCPIKSHCNFLVTVQHADAGWNHHADRWEVLAPDRTVLGLRALWHPHVNEQPFKRLLERVAIPADVTRVIIRAHDSVHGYGDKEKEVLLPQH
jgi:hypothetical protein